MRSQAGQAHQKQSAAKLLSQCCVIFSDDCGANLLTTLTVLAFRMRLDTHFAF